MNNELFFLEVGLVWDFLVDGVEGLGWVSLEFLVLFVQCIFSDMVSFEFEGFQNSFQVVFVIIFIGEFWWVSIVFCLFVVSFEVFDGFSSIVCFDFKIFGFFFFGFLLGLVLVLCKIVMFVLEVVQMCLVCEQIYNFFYVVDFCVLCFEFLLVLKFQVIVLLIVFCYQKFFLGDGLFLLLVDILQMYFSFFLEELEMLVFLIFIFISGVFWKGSELVIEFLVQLVVFSIISEVVKILECWWGIKWIDYLLYCFEVFIVFFIVMLFYFFYVSYWEFVDVVVFILCQVIEKEWLQLVECEELFIYSLVFFREKWQ